MRDDNSHDDHTPIVSPVNPVSPVVVALFIAMIGVECAFYLGAKGLIGGPGAIGWRLGAMQTYGFSGVVFDWMVAHNQWPVEHVMRFVSYPFVHGGFSQALFAGVLLLAMGKFVGEVFAQWAVLVVFIGSGAGGAAIWAFLLNDNSYLIGGFPAVYGLIGSFTYLMWLRLGELGETQTRAFSLIGFLVGIQVVFAVLFDTQTFWVADVAGFGVGFLLSFFVAPGGWAKIRAKLRRD